jgi:hypothetical protein
MPATDALYVFSPGEDEGEWVRPQPVEDVVVEEVTSSTDLTADDLDELATYVDLDELETHLADDPAGEALTFAVEGNEVVVEPDGTVRVDPA